MTIMECETLGNAWITAMDLIMTKGEDIFDENIKLKEIRNMYITISDINEDDEIIQKYADHDRVDLMKKKYATCGLVGEYKTDYGSRIYNNNGINQIEWAVERIKNKPETKSATFSLHVPGEKMLPCLSLVDFKLRENKLDMTVVYRSQNIYWSHPGNLLALRQMQRDVVREIGCDIGKIELVVVSAHIYEADYSMVKNILNKVKCN